MADKKKTKFFDRFSKRYIIVVYNQNNFKERISLLLSPINLILVLSSLVAFTFILTALLIAFTPIKETIPGFNNSSQSTEKVARLQIRVDSLENALIEQRQIEESLRAMLKGDSCANDTLKSKITGWLNGKRDASAIIFSINGQISLAGINKSDYLCKLGDVLCLL